MISIIVFLLTVTVLANGSNIMIFTPMTSRSESLLFYPYAEALAERGHKVTVVCQYPMKTNSSNIRKISPPEVDIIFKLTDDYGSDVLMDRVKNGHSEYAGASGMDYFAVEIMKALMIESKEILDIVKRKETFDLIVVNNFFNHGGLALASIFNCPFVYVQGAGYYAHSGAATGNTDYSGASPSTFSTFATPMSLYERIYNSFMVYKYHKEYEFAASRVDELLRPVYGKYGMDKSLSEVDKTVSLLFSHRHESMEFHRAMYPNYVRFGCVHCRPGNPLPKVELKMIGKPLPNV